MSFRVHRELPDYANHKRLRTYRAERTHETYRLDMQARRPAGNRYDRRRFHYSRHLAYVRSQRHLDTHRVLRHCQCPVTESMKELVTNVSQVYNHVPDLRVPKFSIRQESFRTRTLPESCTAYLASLLHSFPAYFTHTACLPSLSLSILYLTVLSFGGQMITYLVSAGFTSFVIALIRSLSVIIEITATWIAPRAMKLISPTRAAMWFLSWQTIWLAGTITFFWSETTPIVAASGLAGGTILSRVGLWGFDLCAQTIVQNVRGSFLCMQMVAPWVLSASSI